VDRMSRRRDYNAAQKARVENAGILAASGLIAGEALMGLVVATVVFIRDRVSGVARFPYTSAFEPVAAWVAMAVFAVLVLYLIFMPLRKAGQPDEPAPPSGAF